MLIYLRQLNLFHFILFKILLKSPFFLIDQISKVWENLMLLCYKTGLFAVSFVLGEKRDAIHFHRAFTRK